MTTTQTRRGRPRDEALDRRILRTTQQLLPRVSYDLLTVDAVASTAGVARTTIYRRWRSKLALVIAAVTDLLPDYSALEVGTGSLRDDLVQLFDTNHKQRDRVFAAFASDLPRHPQLKHVWDERITKPMDAIATQLFERAIARGEIPCDLDIPLVLEVLHALTWRRRIFDFDPIDSAFIEHNIDQVILPLVFARHKRSSFTKRSSSPEACAATNSKSAN